MGKTSDLRKEIKVKFIPYMQAQGFTVDTRGGPSLLSFRRITESAVHVCELQFEKYGYPRFVVKFGSCSPTGLTVGGTHIKAADVHSWDIPVNGSLKPGKSMSSRHWFRQDKPLLQSLFAKEKMYPPAHPVADLMRLFPEVENFWATGKAGPHCHVYDFSDIHEKMAQRV